MACTALTKGRGLDCNRISGGVKKIFFSCKTYLYKFKPESSLIGGAFVYKIVSGDLMATGKMVMVK